MGFQPFGFSQGLCRWTQLLQGSVIDINQAGQFNKIGDIERGGEAGGAAGGQNMARSGDVIAQHHSPLFPQHDAAGIGDTVKIGIGIFALIVMLPFVVRSVEFLFGGLVNDMVLILR